MIHKTKFCDYNWFYSNFSGLGSAANVRRYVALAKSLGGACFCTRGAVQGFDVVLFIVALAKTVTPGGSPRREPGPAGWFLPGGFSLKAGPIKHQLVLVCQSNGPARKSQLKAIAYTDLLGNVVLGVTEIISCKSSFQLLIYCVLRYSLLLWETKE
jgi:hypothetical protein